MECCVYAIFRALKLPVLQYLQQSQHKATEVYGCLLGHGDCNTGTLPCGLSSANPKVLWDLLV